MKLADMFSLKGKVALVTGGGRGIGKFIATGLAEAGADIILTSRKMKNLEATAKELEETQKVKALAIACDMAKEDAIDAMLAEAVAKFGHIDILVNNAGATWGAPTLDFPLDKWDQLFNVNVRGVWILTQKVARIMKEQGGGNIINISSVMAFRGSLEEAHPAVPYNSTKAAINLLTMNLAVKLAPHHIRVNAISAGPIKTLAAAGVSGFRKMLGQVAAATPLRRNVTIDEVGNVAAFLCSDLASGVTGETVYVDAGYSHVGMSFAE